MRRTQVHFHLRKKVWSITERRPGHKRLVLDHVPACVLYHCVFHVGEKTRQTVIRTQVRSVHAWIVGEDWVPGETASTDGLRRISYNPYRAGYFHTADGRPVWSADRVVFGHDGAYI